MQVTCGMSKQAVEKLLGKPLNIREDSLGATMWIYSAQKDQAKGYEYRAVDFSPDDNVLRTNSHRYLD